VRYSLLDTMNAGVDDGVPASILREINYMRKLQGCNIQKLVQVQMDTNCVKIQYEHHTYNLREYIQCHMRTIEVDQCDVLANKKCSVRTVGLAKIRQVIGRIVDVLAFCHGQGIMHRNLKPDNVLLDCEGNPVLSDFTCAR
jgi:serine/threonine protein kinase